MILYFSGNGNSRFVAEALAQTTHDRAVPVTEAPTDLQDEVLGWVFPVHAWGPPKVLCDFIRRTRPTTCPTYVYAVCTCGDDVGRTDQLLRKSLHERGIELSSVWSLQMPNTYIGLPGFDVDATDVVERKIQALPPRLVEIASCINRRQTDIVDVVPGAFPWCKSHVLRPLFYKLFTGDRHFSTTPSCTGCGHCTKACPLHNITLVEGRPVWQGHCTDCLACYHRCPHHAVRFGRWSKGKGQMNGEWQHAEELCRRSISSSTKY